MQINPFSDPFDLRVICLTKPAEIDLFQVLLPLFLASLDLPRRGEDFMNFVVQIPLLQGFPFVLIRPDSLAMAALLQSEAQTVANLVFDQDTLALRAQFDPVVRLFRRGNVNNTLSSNVIRLSEGFTTSL
jgi:hypothetical protein